MRKRVYKVVHFDASHRLLKYEGKCSRLHGHRWKVEVWCDGEIDDETGILVDYNLIKEVVERLDHQVILNSADPLAACLSKHHPIVTTEGDPSSEIIGMLLHDMLEDEFGKAGSDARVFRIRVWESPTCCAEIEYAGDRDLQEHTG